MSAQIIVTSPQPAYEFLLCPPPPKPRPTQPLPPTPTTKPFIASRPRSSTFSAISTWAARVHPGSPEPTTPPPTSSTSPLSRCSSLFRHPLSPFRTPRSARAQSTSFLQLADTPKSSGKARTPEHDFDLAALGYAYAVVPLPTTPHTAGLSPLPALEPVPAPWPESRALLAIPARACGHGRAAAAAAVYLHTHAPRVPPRPRRRPAPLALTLLPAAALDGVCAVSTGFDDSFLPDMGMEGVEVVQGVAY
ncbi:hypothetical protein BC834DRAFT_394929 [Gloeopeniophorella convolvens]|nr:hypothetical protein BC834DRAFT_394929 [Gloeopeniophorella convolvens]